LIWSSTLNTLHQFGVWQRFGSEFSTSLIFDDPSPCWFGPLLVSISVQREIDFEVRQFQGLEDVFAVLVSFDRDALDVDPGRGGVTMPERVLGLAEGPRALGHHPREGVARLVQMNLADPRLPGVALQVLDEGPGGELRARLPGAVVSGPERLIFSQDMQPPAAPQIVEQRRLDPPVGHLPPLIIALSLPKNPSPFLFSHLRTSRVNV